MKKLIVAVSFAATVMTLGACSEKTSSEEQTQTFTKSESEQESLKVVKTMFKHLEEKDADNLKGDFYLDDQTYLTMEAGNTPISYTIKQFINKYSDYDYGTKTELSVIPQKEWSKEFKDDKKEIKNNYRAIILAKYTGGSLGNYSLIIPVQYNRYDKKYEVVLIQDFSNTKIQSLLSDEAYAKYAEETFPLKVQGDYTNDSNSDNYFSSSVIRKLLTHLHKVHSDVAGNSATSIRRTGDNTFLVKTDKEEMLIEFKDLANNNYLFDWQVTRSGTGEVLLQSDTWE